MSMNRRMTDWTWGDFPVCWGVRGDVRVGGRSSTGQGAYWALTIFRMMETWCSIPAELAAFSNPQGDYLELRNVVMHEHGHGLGLSHVESDDAAFLMEPFYDISFDGPQLDDIRGVHRAYGDALEKSDAGQGNNIAINATPLGRLRRGVTISLGRNAGPDTIVTADESDFISIDDNSDIDFFSFEVAEAAIVDVTLTPVGPTYLEGPRFGSSSQLDSSAVSDLGLGGFRIGWAHLLGSANQFGPGNRGTDCRIGAARRPANILHA